MCLHVLERHTFLIMCVTIRTILFCFSSEKKNCMDIMHILNTKLTFLKVNLSRWNYRWNFFGAQFFKQCHFNWWISSLPSGIKLPVDWTSSLWSSSGFNFRAITKQTFGKSMSTVYLLKHFKVKKVLIKLLLNRSLLKATYILLTHKKSNLTGKLKY